MIRRPTLKKSKAQLLFSIALVFLYLAIFIFLDKLQFPPKWDEPDFWQASLLFSHSLIPSLSQLKNYGELNTPLPFISFGIIEYFWSGGIFAGRFFNFVLSFAIVCLIGLSVQSPQKRLSDSFLSAFGLLCFPYYLWCSSHLYTDILAAFFVFLGFCFYVQKQHILSSIAFILAIASRQYMVVFPVAIAAFELTNSLKSKVKINISWIAPLVAASTLLGWFFFFKGIAPAAALAEGSGNSVPVVQRKWIALAPNASLYFLACVGLYFVIPEWILFSRRSKLRRILTRTNFFIALSLLLAFVLFPPLNAHGLLVNGSRFLFEQNRFLRVALFYILAFLACLRFSQLNLAFWLLFVNCGLMLKAYPWDKYLLPLLVVFWYLKSINALEQNQAAKLPTVDRKMRAFLRKPSRSNGSISTSTD